MNRLLLFCSLLILGACGVQKSAATDRTQVAGPSASLVAQAIESRVATCIANGLSEASCKCSAVTSSQIFDDEDFLTESELKRRGDRSAMDEFLRRKYAEDPETMFELGKALQDCPASILPTELTP